VLRLVRGAAGTKAAPAATRSRPAPPPMASDVGWVDVPDLDDTVRDRAQTALAAALAADAARWASRAAVRLGGPKARRGTRHWTAAPGLPTDTRQGSKALDPNTGIDPDQWAADAQDTAHPILQDAATAAAAAMLLSLRDDDDPDHPGMRPGLPSLLAAPSAEQIAAVADRAIQPALNMVAESARRQAADLTDRVGALDQAGADITTILDTVKAHGTRLTTWANGLAEHAAAATVEGARYEAAEAAPGVARDDVRRQWITRKDAKVRPTHMEAHGQMRQLGEDFKVGTAALRFPGDPQGPIEETANCRCKLHYRHRVTGRYLPKTVAATG